jgi:NAD(P)-dependent dehydrogenase (short-subunit alcohol dehydrogenase family)
MTKKIYIVTGAAGNLGRAVLCRLALDGAYLVGVDRETDTLNQALISAGGDSHLPLPGIDLLNSQSCEFMIERVITTYGRIDGVVHTVGGFAASGIDECSVEQFEHLFRLNVLTTVNVFKAAAHPMRQSNAGCMIALGAGLGVKTPSGLSAYGASKSAVHRIIESFAEELKTSGVRVNAILPSTLDTPLNRQSMPEANHSSWVSLDRLASLIAFVLSDTGRDITGALIPVNGRI